MEAIRALLELLPWTFRVKFSLYCALDCSANLDEKTKAPAMAAIQLTQKWLDNPSSVSSQELYDIANSAAYSAANSANSAAYSAAYSAANSAAYSAAYSAANSANSAAYSAAYSAANSANSAAYSAANSANSAANSASSAAYSANSAANSAAFNKEYKKKLKQYENHLKAMIKDMTRLQKEIYNLGEKRGQ